MYLFSRSRCARSGQGRAAVAAGLEAASRVKQITGFEVGVWTTALSAEVGRLVWTTQFDHLDEFETATGKLMADTAHGDWLESNDSLFEGPSDDACLQVLSGGPGPEPPAYAQVVTAVVANGALAAGMAGGMEVAEAATRITGNTTSFCTALTGQYGGVVWVTGVPSLAAAEEANAALAASEEWLAIVDRVAPSFGPGATSTLYRRIG